jgi:hypothetical protein
MIITNQIRISIIPKINPARAMPLPSLFNPMIPKIMAKGPKSKPYLNNPRIPRTKDAIEKPFPPPLELCKAAFFLFFSALFLNCLGIDLRI